MALAGVENLADLAVEQRWSRRGAAIEGRGWTSAAEAFRAAIARISPKTTVGLLGGGRQYSHHAAHAQAQANSPQGAAASSGKP